MKKKALLSQQHRSQALNEITKIMANKDYINERKEAIYNMIQTINSITTKA